MTGPWEGWAWAENGTFGTGDDLGLQGLGILAAVSLGFGAITHLIA